MRARSVFALLTCLLSMACDDGASRPAVVPTTSPTVSARESRDPPPAKPPEVIDNTVAAKAADGGAPASDAGAAHKVEAGAP